MLFAAEIPDAYLVAALPVVLVAIIGLMTWMVREMGKIQIINAAQGRDINAQHDLIVAQQATMAAQAIVLTQQAIQLGEHAARLRVLEREAA